MPDLAVHTGELRVAASELRAVVNAADDLDSRSARAMAAVPGFGLAGPAQAADSFLSAWVFGVGWIGAQAHEIAGVLVGSADAFDAVEARLSRDLVEGGGGPMVVPPPVVGSAPEPRRPASGTHWGLLGSANAPMPVQLSSARHAGELIAGDPELVAELARILQGFADALGDAWFSLTRVSLGGWTGATASVVGGQLTELLGRLANAEKSFAEAAQAVGRYARVHAEARHDASVALVLWQGAEHVSQVWRGVVPGVAPPSASGEDPGLADMARAAAMLARAREALDAAGRALVLALNELEVGSPKDPGVLATITRGVASFGGGFTQGVVGIAEGTLQMAALAARLNPARAVLDPEGYQETVAGLVAATSYAIRNMDKVGSALVDWETLTSDPVRWVGKLAPELILMAATMGAAGAARAAKATDKLEGAAAAIRQAQMTGQPLIPRVTSSTISARLAELGVDASTPAGRATRSQLQISPGNPDQWLNLPLRDGQRIAFHDTGSELASPAAGDITRSSEEWFEGLQVAPKRDVIPGEPIPHPTTPGVIDVYEVRGGDLGAAQSTALSNPQFGSGGGTQVFVPDVNDAIRDGRLVKVDEHHFDPETTRATYEDATYRQVDSTLPEHALDPDKERTLGQIDRAREEAGRAAGGAAASGTYDRMDESTKMDEGPTLRDHDSEGIR